MYLKSSALDSEVVSWAYYGTGETRPMAGDWDERAYRTGVGALRDGLRLIQASPMIPEPPGDGFETGYLKYEFFFEKPVDVGAAS